MLDPYRHSCLSCDSKNVKRYEEMWRDISWCILNLSRKRCSIWMRSVTSVWQIQERKRERGNKKNQIIEIESTIPFPQLLCACSSGQVANDFLRLTGTASLFSLVAASCPFVRLLLALLPDGLKQWWHHATSLPQHYPLYLSVMYWNILKHIETIFDHLWSFDFMSLLRWTWHFLILSLRGSTATCTESSINKIQQVCMFTIVHPSCPESHWMMQNRENFADFAQNIVQKSSESSEHLSEHGQEKPGEYMLYCYVLLSVPRCHQNLSR